MAESVSVDRSSWERWKQRAEGYGLPNVLSSTALMVLWLLLGENCWRRYDP
jgi:hypothetical protein